MLGGKKLKNLSVLLQPSHQGEGGDSIEPVTSLTIYDIAAIPHEGVQGHVGLAMARRHSAQYQRPLLNMTGCLSVGSILPCVK